MRLVSPGVIDFLMFEKVNEYSEPFKFRSYQSCKLWVPVGSLFGLWSIFLFFGLCDVLTGKAILYENV